MQNSGVYLCEKYWSNPFRQRYVTQKHFISLGSLLNVRYLNSCFIKDISVIYVTFQVYRGFFRGGGITMMLKKTLQK